MVKNILSKIDIARDQVFVKTIIMEMNATKTQTWGVDYYAFDRSSKGVGRIGFRSSPIGSLLNPATDSGAILGFGSGQTFELKAGDFTATVTSLVGLIKFLKGAAGGNVLSTPQIMALDNEEAEIEVGETIPVNLSRDSTATAGTLSTTANREDVTIKLNLTPFISPDTDSVKLKIEQQVKQLSRTKVEADELAKSAVATTKRVIKTQIVVNSGDTAVLGGLMSDVESEDVTKVPVLGDIPILGWLFKGKTVDKRKSNLVVFITPKIIRNTTDNANLLNEKINERITFIQRYMNGRDPHGEAIDKLPRRSFGNNQPPPSSPAPLIDSDDGPDDDGSAFSDDEPKEEPAVETF